MADNLFKKYRAKIAREGILKAFLFSTCIGLGVLSLTVLLSWFFGFKAGLWVGLGLFVAISVALAPVFYYKLYRPTTKAIAKRVDELGLEERVLTMVELENDASYMAMRQREDTLRALGTVNHMLVKVAVSAALVAVFSVGLVIGTSSVTVGALYMADVLPSGISLVREEVLPNTYTLTYSVSRKTGGSIVMYTDDWTKEESVSEEIIVKEGENAPAVLAVSDENFIFIGWSDGVTEAYRQDVDVKGNLEVEAVFLRLVESVADPEKAGFDTPNIYREPSDGEPSDEEGPPFPPQEGGSDDMPPMEYEPGNGPGNQMQNADNNQIHDGNTFYGDTYQDAHDGMMDRLGSDESVPGDLKDSVSDYFDSIEQGSSKGDEGGD